MIWLNFLPSSSIWSFCAKYIGFSTLCLFVTPSFASLVRNIVVVEKFKVQLDLPKGQFSYPSQVQYICAVFNIQNHIYNAATVIRATCTCIMCVPVLCVTLYTAQPNIIHSVLLRICEKPTRELEARLGFKSASGF